MELARRSCLTEHRLKSITEGHGTSRPLTPHRLVAFPSKHVVSLDAGVLGGAHRLNEADRLAHDAGGVREVVVGGDDENAMMGRELSANLADLFGAAQPLESVDCNQIHDHLSGLDILKHGLKARSLLHISSADAVVTVFLDRAPGVAEPSDGGANGVELLVGRTLVLLNGTHSAVHDVGVRLAWIVWAFKHRLCPP